MGCNNLCQRFKSVTLSKEEYMKRKEMRKQGIKVSRDQYRGDFVRCTVCCVRIIRNEKSRCPCCNNRLRFKPKNNEREEKRIGTEDIENEEIDVIIKTSVGSEINLVDLIKLMETI